MKKHPTIQAMIQAEAPPPKPGAEPVSLLVARIKAQSPRATYAVFFIDRNRKHWRVVPVTDWRNHGTVRTGLLRLEPVAYAPVT